MAETEQPKSRKERERLTHRRQIMQTAMELFAERGYADVSMQEIAEKAEFAVGTLYNLFTNKEALYREIIRSHARSIYERLIPPLEENVSAEDRLRRFIRTHRSVFLEHAGAVRLYLSETIGLGILTRDEEVHGLWREGIARIVRVIDEGIEAGDFRKVDSTAAALALSGALETAAFAEIEKCINIENTEKSLETIFLNGLLKEKNG